MKLSSSCMVVALVGLTFVPLRAPDVRRAVDEATALGQREQFVDPRDGQRYWMVEIATRPGSSAT